MSILKIELANIDIDGDNKNILIATGSLYLDSKLD